MPALFRLYRDAYSGLPTATWLLAVVAFVKAPALAAYVGSRAPPEARGRYLGAYGVTFAVAWLLSPLLGTQLYQRVGPDAVWYAAGLVRRRRRPRLPQNRPGRAAPASRRSPVNRPAGRAAW